MSTVDGRRRKNTKYFMNLEKINAKKKNLHSLKCGEKNYYRRNRSVNRSS